MSTNTKNPVHAEIEEGTKRPTKLEKKKLRLKILICGLIFLVVLLLAGVLTVVFSEKRPRITPKVTSTTSSPTSTTTITSAPTPQPIPGFETSSPTFVLDPGNDTAFTILQVFPHDPTAFTQGLLFHDGFLYEGTGQNGRSSVRKVDPTTGEVLKQRDLSSTYFGEGLTKINNTLLQLTWKQQTAFVYDFTTFEQQDQFEYTTTRNEGWGIAYTDDTNYFSEPTLVMSDGSSFIHFWDPVTFVETKRIQIKDIETARAVSNLNELEFVKGELLANIWFDSRIARIDIDTGFITGYYDFSQEKALFGKGGDVLNGIAYDAAGDVLYVTGKYWENMLKVRLNE